MKTYVFNENEWQKDFHHVYSYVAKSYRTFVTEGAALVNTYNEQIHDYDYTSLAYNTPCRSGAQISTLCSFDSFGAPLVTIANAVFCDGGIERYGDHYEVVAYEGGCNVWFVTKAPEGSVKPYVSKKCLAVHFPIAPKSKIELSVKILDKVAHAELCGVSFDLPLPLLSDTFYLGITACEGINRFYEVSISPEKV